MPSTLARAGTGVPATPVAPAAAESGRALPFAEAARTRLLYVMLFRVGLVTLLLASALVAEIGAGVGEQTSPVVSTLFALIVATYGLTIVFALAAAARALRRAAGGRAGRLGPRAHDAARAPDRRRRVGVRVHVHPRRRRRGVRARARRAGGGGGGGAALRRSTAVGRLGAADAHAHPLARRSTRSRSPRRAFWRRGWRRSCGARASTSRRRGSSCAIWRRCTRT